MVRMTLKAFATACVAIVPDIDRVRHGIGRSVSARRASRERQADRLFGARRPLRRLQDRDQAHRGRQVVSLHGPFLQSGLEHRRRHRPGQSALCEIHSLRDRRQDHHHRAGDAARQSDDHLAQQFRAAEEPEAGGVAVGHFRSGKSQAGRLVDGRRRPARIAIPIPAANTPISPPAIRASRPTSW